MESLSNAHINTTNLVSVWLTSYELVYVIFLIIVVVVCGIMVILFFRERNTLPSTSALC